MLKMLVRILETGAYIYVQSANILGHLLSAAQWDELSHLKEIICQTYDLWKANIVVKRIKCFDDIIKVG